MCPRNRHHSGSLASGNRFSLPTIFGKEIAFLCHARNNVLLHDTVPDGGILWTETRAHAKAIRIAAARPTHPKMEAIAARNG